MNIIVNRNPENTPLDLADITPVILAGGIGTRLWPISTKRKPKPFIKLWRKRTFLQETADRVKDCAAPCIICSADHRELVTRQIPHADQILLEPEGRNTAPAIAAAAHFLAHKSDKIMLVLPSDHIIKDVPAFLTAVSGAMPAARSGKLVTFGITPNTPSSRFGYIQTEESANDNKLRAIARFVEKPDKTAAKVLLNYGNCYWNSGIFMFSAQTFLNALYELQPDIHAHSYQAVASASRIQNAIMLEQNAFAECRSISVDYAVMEHAPNKVVMPVDMKWCDMGTWPSLLSALLKA